MKWRRSLLLACCFVCLLMMAGLAWAVPGTINYQGNLADSKGNPLSGSYDMIFSLYETSMPFSKPVWTEEQDKVPVTDGVYNVQLGSVNPIKAANLAYDAIYLQVTIYYPDTQPWEQLLPLSHLTSSPYSILAGDADLLDGLDSTALDQRAHVARTDNPHQVTAAQVGAATLSDITWGHLTGIPTDIADGDDVGVTEESDPTVLASVKDGVSWGEVIGKPAGFEDGVDNDSGGILPGLTQGQALPEAAHPAMLPWAWKFPSSSAGPVQKQLFRLPTVARTTAFTVFTGLPPAPGLS